ncbi:MAG: M14 family zinc carboxypeptidase [Spirochaetota bacterium]
MSTTKEILRFDRWERRLIRLVRRADGMVRIRQLDYSSPTRDGQRYPIYMLEIGRRSAFKRHAVSVVSGVHGLETIGIRIHLDVIKCLMNPKSPHFSQALADGKFGIYSLPILNPAGVARETRANGRGVDLNRNSGIDAEGAIPFFGGQRISPALPYFRGKALERESRALFRFLREYAWKNRRIHTALDIHSGYGAQNYLWWPYSFSKRRIPHSGVFEQLGAELATRHPLYRIEPMSLSYQTHGDLWDRALIEFEEAKKQGKLPRKNLFLPLTLEIGTWEELKKNPFRVLQKRKIFNPPPQSRKAYLREHRQLIWDLLHLHVKRSDQRRYVRLRDAS